MTTVVNQGIFGLILYLSPNLIAVMPNTEPAPRGYTSTADRLAHDPTQLPSVVGGRIWQILFEEGDPEGDYYGQHQWVGLLVRTPQGEWKTLWFAADPEMNGPGFVDVGTVDEEDLLPEELKTP